MHIHFWARCQTVTANNGITRTTLICEDDFSNKYSQEEAVFMNLLAARGVLSEGVSYSVHIKPGRPEQENV